MGGIIEEVSRDARMLSSSSLDSVIHIWNTVQKRVGGMIEESSRDAKMLASISLDSAIHIWNTETGGWGDCSAE